MFKGVLGLRLGCVRVCQRGESVGGEGFGGFVVACVI